MGNLKRFIIFVTIAALLLSSVGMAAADAEGFRLPEALTVIEEEAFAGVPMLGRVELPEQVLEIRARAFAGSGVTEINLPASLIFIAEDAFDASALAVVTAEEGTYAYDWAVAHGYIVPVLPLSAAIACSAAEAQTGETAVWTVEAQGGSGEYGYAFELYCDDTLLLARDFDADNRFTAEFDNAGSYQVVARVTDGQDQIELRSDSLAVAAAPLVITGLEVQRKQVLTAQTQTWTVSATGGERPYRYSYKLTKDGQTVESQPFSSNDRYSYTFFTNGSYTLHVQVKDADGAQSAEVDFPFTVSAQNASMTGVVRIYIECDEKGNILTSNSNVGHYELEIKGADPEISFDNHLFTNPVFSFGSGPGSAGQVTVYDGEIVPRTGVLLYTFEFTTTANSVGATLYERLRDTYLNTENEVENDYGYVYSVSSGPFVKYNIKTSNCFTAVAAWASWLGYGTLSSIVSSSSSYTDYIAWRTYKKYGGAWHYEGYYGGAAADAGEAEDNADDDAAAITEKVVSLALGQLGKPYVYSGGYKTKSPSGFDCSGLTYWAYYWGAGITLADSAYGQGNDSKYAKIVDKSKLKRGDILCFTDDDTIISHVGLYLGNNSFVHASNSSKKVITSTFTNYWTRNLKWGYHVVG